MRLLFDWGSFLGGVIGSLGAFGAAGLVYYLQYRPTVMRRRIELRLKAIRSLDRAQGELQSAEAESLPGLAKILEGSLVSPLFELMALSAEVEPRWFRVYRQLYVEVSDLLMSIRTDGHYKAKLKSDGYQPDASRVAATATEHIQAAVKETLGASSLLK